MLRGSQKLLEIGKVIQASEFGYTRPVRARGARLDHQRIDWQALQDQLDNAPRGVKHWVMISWAYRIKCSERTLYRGLHKYKKHQKEHNL
jgi:hypothetical protein